MEGIARLVSESMASHGMDCHLDHRRLHWSRWLPCGTSCDLMLVPTRPGLFAIAEELMAPGEAAACEGKHRLAISKVYATEDLATTMSRLLARNNSLKDRAAQRRIFARFTVIEDDAQHGSAQTGFRRWLMISAAAGSGMVHDLDDCAEVPSTPTESEPERCKPRESRSEDRAANVHSPGPLRAAFSMVTLAGMLLFIDDPGRRRAASASGGVEKRSTPRRGTESAGISLESNQERDAWPT